LVDRRPRVLVGEGQHFRYLSLSPDVQLDHLQCLVSIDAS
jgi:hypothetical protein